MRPPGTIPSPREGRAGRGPGRGVRSNRPPPPRPRNPNRDLNRILHPPSPPFQNPEGVTEISPGSDRRGKGARSYPGYAPPPKFVPSPREGRAGRGPGRGGTGISMSATPLLLGIITTQIVSKV